MEGTSAAAGSLRIRARTGGLLLVGAGIAAVAVLAPASFAAFGPGVDPENVRKV